MQPSQMAPPRPSHDAEEERNLPGVILNAMCCARYLRYTGENELGYFPRNQAELEQMGARWMTKALTANGTLKDGCVVTTIACTSNNEGGLLGDMCVVNLQYSRQTDAPTKLMAKFRPPDQQTRTTIAVARFCEKEYDVSG